MHNLIKQPIKISKDHYLLTINCKDCIVKAGQFINIKVDDSNHPLLRKPISIFNYDNDMLEIVVRIAGKGTEMLANMSPQEMDILGPLGNGFTILKNSRVLIIGGGVGNAPLYQLAKELKEAGNTIDFIYGSKSSEYIYEANRFREICDSLTITTDDGSAGEKGFVTDAMTTLISKNRYDYIYTCGPTPMMKAVCKKAPEDITVELSVENYFGCGVGLCVGCTVETNDGYKRACVDGPVFTNKDLIVEKLEG